MVQTEREAQIIFFLNNIKFVAIYFNLKSTANTSQETLMSTIDDLLEHINGTERSGFTRL